MCEKSGHISYVMLRSAATKHLGRGNLHHPRFFVEFILSAVEGLRMTFHTPLKTTRDS
jgi:hypothetical protein